MLILRLKARTIHVEQSTHLPDYLTAKYINHFKVERPKSSLLWSAQTIQHLFVMAGIRAFIRCARLNAYKGNIMRKLILITLSLLLFSSHALAEWKLNSSESSLHFISIKKSSVAEIHHFKSISGDVDAQGGISIAINLASVESNIPIRNERMQNMLFNIEKFTQANIRGKVDLKQLASLAVG